MEGLPSAWFATQLHSGADCPLHCCCSAPHLNPLPGRSRSKGPMLPLQLAALTVSAQLSPPQVVFVLLDKEASFYRALFRCLGGAQCLPAVHTNPMPGLLWLVFALSVPLQQRSEWDMEVGNRKLSCLSMGNHVYQGKLYSFPLTALACYPSSGPPRCCSPSLFRIHRWNSTVGRDAIFFFIHENVSSYSVRCDPWALTVSFLLFFALSPARLFFLKLCAIKLPSAVVLDLCSCSSCSLPATKSCFSASCRSSCASEELNVTG